MIQYDKFQLDNGLRVIVHEDNSTPIVALNILYDIGAKHEHPDKTGFAHLFEHLMFGGSANIPKYDEPLEKVGGSNNAFTNNDITNYYLTIPKQNLETAFWLESDRMLQLAFSEKSLDVQRNVVCEEFKQNYLNQPYGDLWMLLRPLAYKKHPYRWSTIGKDIAHIENAIMDDVKDFYNKYYNPDNAIMVVAGPVKTEEIKQLCKKWFEPIKKSSTTLPIIHAEPIQKQARRLTVEREVPCDVIYKAYHMCNRVDKNFYSTDLVSDILSTGTSSRFYKELIIDQKLFSSVNAYHLGHSDKGLFVISGRISDGVNFDKAEEAINNEVEKIKTDYVLKEELEKVQNKIETETTFMEISVLNKAMNLAYFEHINNADMINEETKRYRNVSLEDIRNTSKLLLNESNCSTLYYKAKK